MRGLAPHISMKGEAFRLKKNLIFILILKDFKDFEFKYFEVIQWRHLNGTLRG